MEVEDASQKMAIALVNVILSSQDLLVKLLGMMTVTSMHILLYISL
jgi:hypothetical protein